ncbi:uncharacterized protein LOC141510361 [Macrotis lagotis]|uniref:uncharacterized protein LOC141510361 n=1 Tax=Macrotis lagotis TaxID=92651 RepID=UPI003D681724
MPTFPSSLQGRAASTKSILWCFRDGLQQPRPGRRHRAIAPRLPQGRRPGGPCASRGWGTSHQSEQAVIAKAPGNCSSAFPRVRVGPGPFEGARLGEGHGVLVTSRRPRHHGNTGPGLPPRGPLTGRASAGFGDSPRVTQLGLPGRIPSSHWATATLMMREDSSPTSTRQSASGPEQTVYSGHLMCALLGLQWREHQTGAFRSPGEAASFPQPWTVQLKGSCMDEGAACGQHSIVLLLDASVPW